MDDIFPKQPDNGWLLNESEIQMAAELGNKRTRIIDEVNKLFESFEILLHEHRKKYCEEEISGFIVSDTKYNFLTEYCRGMFSLCKPKTETPMYYKGIDIYPSRLMPGDKIGCITTVVKTH